MARRKKKSTESNFGDYSLVQLSFNDREKKEIADHYDGLNVDYVDMIQSFGESGFKFSVSYSDGWDNWVVSITNKTAKDVQAGAVYLVRHASFERSLQIAHYFLTVMYENGDARLRTEEESYDW